MSYSSLESDPPITRKVPVRAWILTLSAALAGIAAGIVAVVLEGTLRAAFAGAAIVFISTAFFCAGVTSLESSSGPGFDLDEPPPIPPVPQSQVTLVYNPREAPDNSPGARRGKPARLRLSV
jgi:hypothetical protein